MFLNFSAFSFLAMISLFLLAPETSRAADYPVITFEYADLYDRFCVDATKKTIEPAEVEELQNRIESFRAEWQRQAPQLYRMTVKLTKAPFAFKEAKAALSLCNPGSLSFPLIINVRPYLKSINGEKALPLEDFVAAVFHETLHRFINDRKELLPGKTTPILERHKNEPAPVRNHIHLYAVFDEVYKKLGRQKDLEAIIRFEDSLSSAAIFRRAREIVAQEGTKNVVCEISKNGCSRKKS